MSATFAAQPSMVQYFTERETCPECRRSCGGGLTMDGLWRLCAVEIGACSRSIYPGRGGEVLYCYPNPDVVPPAELLPAPTVVDPANKNSR